MPHGLPHGYNEGEMQEMVARLDEDDKLKLLELMRKARGQQ
jgi:hypothetical protein